jgi:hypothetical protein
MPSVINRKDFAMQNSGKYVNGLSPLMALLFVVVMTFSGGAFMALANGSTTPLFTCEVIKGIGNTTLTNTSLQVGTGKQILGLQCNGTKPQANAIAVAAAVNGYKSNSGKTNTNAKANLLFSCNAVKGVGNTKLTISPPLLGTLKTIYFGLNCKTAGVGIDGNVKPGVNGVRNDLNDLSCTPGVGTCVAIVCTSDGQTVPCLDNNGVAITSCYWDADQAQDNGGINGCRPQD